MNTSNTSKTDNSKNLEFRLIKHGAKCNTQSLKIDGSLIPIKMDNKSIPIPGEKIKMTIDDLRQKWRIYK